MSKKPKKLRNVVHTDLQLRKATDYLEYDIHTLAAGLDIYRVHKGKEIGNAAVDSLLLRARILIDFFFRDSARTTDVIALDYFHDFDPKPYKPKMPKYLSSERDKINTWLMHLTTQPMPRLRSNQRYRVDKLVKPIVRAFRAWLQVVPDDRLQQPPAESRRNFEKHLQRIERLLPEK
jgi:hypothetical protein